jgi:uncharacterized BrkB/YihY/UPF0761 family membrane protein
VLGERRATMLFWILDRYGQAGAGIIATGLALRALRTLLLFVLFVVAVSGWIVSDPSVQQAINDALVLVAPPFADLIGSGLDTLAANRVPLGLLGIAGLLWGVSGFYETLDDAMSRIIPGPRRRDLVERRGRGVLTALLAVLALLAIAGLITVLAGAEALIDQVPGGALAWHLLTLVGAAVFVALVVLVVYRFVPTAPPTVRQALLPALLVGGIIAILTSLYAIIVPLLVRAFTVFGALAALIGALMWLEYVFQAILFGGTWAAWRRDAARGATGPSEEPTGGPVGR